MIHTLLLPDTSALYLQALSIDDQEITLFTQSTQYEASCPACNHGSTIVHSRYQRTVADLPCAQRSVCLKLTVRRVFCQNPNCMRRTFTEGLPQVVAPYARRTRRLADEQRHLALAEAGEQGARTAHRQAMPTSSDTLLRLIRCAPQEEAPTPSVLGVDDWAFSKGQTYGTILVDLEKRKPVDLLPDREADTLAAWLEQHPGVEVISRDRATAYAEGATRGAPEAVQVADRFHLHMNLRQALERLLGRKQSSLTAASEIPETTKEEEKRTVSTQAACDLQPVAAPREMTRREQAREASRARRMARYEQVLALHKQGQSLRAIAQALHIGRRTVRRYFQADAFPERAQPKPRASILDRFTPYMKQRMREGCDNGMQLWREIRERGYSGSRSLVSRWVAQQRGAYPRAHSPKRRGRPPRGSPSTKQKRRLSARQASWLLIRDDEELTAEERLTVERLEQSSQEIALARGLAHQFRDMLRHQEENRFDAWLGAVAQSQVKELVSFAKGLRQDEAAVRGALSLVWSNAQVEGQVNRLKLIKRQMYGRAKFDLLRARVLAA